MEKSTDHKESTVRRRRRTKGSPAACARWCPETATEFSLASSHAVRRTLAEETARARPQWRPTPACAMAMVFPTPMTRPTVDAAARQASIPARRRDRRSRMGHAIVAARGRSHRNPADSMNDCSRSAMPKAMNMVIAKNDPAALTSLTCTFHRAGEKLHRVLPASALFRASSPATS